MTSTLGYSKYDWMNKDTDNIFQFYWNMIKPIKGKTPAMEEQIAVEPWTWNDLLTYHYTT